MWRILAVFSWYLAIRVRLFSELTSTHVENTANTPVDSGGLRDHLHTRGEYTVTPIFFNEDRGSPPHTWRILDALSTKIDGIGITSTHVENTLLWLQSLTLVQDHLHTRGEYTKQIPLYQ